MDHLFYPEYFKPIILGGVLAERLDNHAERIANTSSESLAMPTSVVIRTRNNRDNLENLFNELEAQDYEGEIEAIVVDTESNDGTVDVAKALGATVIPITQEEFTYPKSLNQGFKAASYDSIFSTVGHANLSNDQTLAAVNYYIGDVSRVSGVYGFALPNTNASWQERMFATSLVNQIGEVHFPKKPNIGVLAATCAAIDKSVWEHLGGFDERFESGGEDTELAKRMLENNFVVVRDPALSVHHSHGLNVINSIKQLNHWQTILKGPQKLDKEALAKRRPDLNLT